MKIKMRTLSISPLGIRKVGSIVEVSEQEGRDLVNGGYAEELPETSEALQAKIETPERASEPNEFRDGELTAEEAEVESKPKTKKNGKK